MDLKIEYLDINDLKPYGRNAKKHPKEQVQRIVNSIKEFGMCDPIGIWGKDNLIVEGHGRLFALKELGYTEVPVIRLDHLTEEQRKAYTLAHNKTNESEWDLEILEKELNNINFNMSDFGFDLQDDKEEQKELVEDNYKVNVPEVPRAKVGNIYQLGNHRLMCGDSTSNYDLNLLLNNKKVDLVVTDPPYNMNYEGAGNTKDRKNKKILNDNMSDEKFLEFLTNVYCNFKTAMKDGASFYVFYKELGTGVFINALKTSGLTFKQELIWVKNQIVLGGSKYQSMYEPCLFGCNGKSVLNWNVGRKERSVIESIDLMNEEELRKTIIDLLEDETTDIIRERKQLINDLHPTMKPIKLLGKFIVNSSKENESVLDVFGGSGSTLIACEQLNRNCYMMELEPKFVDVIIDRWETFTGKEAVLINGEE